MTDVTRILSAIEQGDPSAAEQLLPLVYEELRKLAAEAMRRILVERARKQDVRERKGLGFRVDLQEDAPVSSSPSVDLLALDEALTELEKEDSRAAELVKLRFFGGLTHQEAARAMGVTRRVADRLWRVARAWLFRRVSRG